MEFCRVCGGAGVHMPDCPARPPEAEREVTPGFLDEEASRLVHVRDSESTISRPLLDKLTAENIEQVIEAGEKIIVDERNRVNEGLKNSSLAKVVRVNADRNCSSHAIQCSIDRGMDYQVAVDKLDDLPEGKAGEPDVREIKEFFSRHVEMNRELTELYKLEIARRLGRLKADPDIFGRLSGRFAEIASGIEKTLDGYEQENEIFLAENEEQRERIASFREKLAELQNADKDELEQNIVELAQDFSMIQFYDSEPKWDDLIEKAKKT